MEWKNTACENANWESWDTLIEPYLEQDLEDKVLFIPSEGNDTHHTAMKRNQRLRSASS